MPTAAPRSAPRRCPARPSRATEAGAGWVHPRSPSKASLPGDRAEARSRPPGLPGEGRGGPAPMLLTGRRKRTTEATHPRRRRLPHPRQGISPAEGSGQGRLPAPSPSGPAWDGRHPPSRPSPGPGTAQRLPTWAPRPAAPGHSRRRRRRPGSCGGRAALGAGPQARSRRRRYWCCCCRWSRRGPGAEETGPRPWGGGGGKRRGRERRAAWRGRRRGGRAGRARGCAFSRGLAHSQPEPRATILGATRISARRKLGGLAAGGGGQEGGPTASRRATRAGRGERASERTRRLRHATHRAKP